MCGIAGISGWAGASPDAIASVQRMTDAMRHRGPDDSGLEVVAEESQTVLGHRRLSIIDLSTAGHQPMLDERTGNWITFNGEIYNYRELRGELEKLGQTFNTQTDTEVILKAYAVWGTRSVEKLRGIFAFAVWDAGLATVFIARDQLGVKPIYYWQDGNLLLFASEVRALLASGAVPRHLCTDGLCSYLEYGSVQEPFTLVKNVKSLLPGQTLSWHAGRLSTACYWRLPPATQVSIEAPSNVNVEIRERLTEAIDLQLVSDVPLGSFLSGGIDSTAIAALAQRTAARPLKTFSVVFDEAAYDERVFARKAAKHLGTDHTELHLTATIVGEGLQDAINAFDQPSVDGLNTYFVSKVTRNAGITVALSGVGGDEVFGGYEGHKKALLAEAWGRALDKVPKSVRSLASNALQRMAVHESVRKAAALLQDPQRAYFLTRGFFSSWQIASLVKPQFRNGTGCVSERITEIVKQASGYDAINRISALELQTYMLSTLLRDTDQMSMAHSLEVRVPLLDHRLVEYMFTLPGKYKVDARQPKPLLTNPLKGAIPSECVHRPKRGFELPFSIWLRDALRGEAQSMFSSLPTNIAAIFEPAGLRQVWGQFERKRVSWSRVWALYILFKWLDRHGIYAE